MPPRTFKENLAIMRDNPAIQKAYQARLNQLPEAKRYAKNRLLEELIRRYYRAQPAPRSENARWLDNSLTMVGVDTL